MDSRVFPEQPGLPPDSSAGEDSVNYLRRLKGSAAEDAPADAGAKRGGATTPTVDWKERRRSPRLRCSGSAEFRTGDSDARMWGTLTDISLHGCYLEVSNAFPVGLRMDLVLKSCGIRIQAWGVVRASNPSLGMGICFTEIKAEEQLHLKRLLAALARHGSASDGGRTQVIHVKDEKLVKDEKTVKETLRAAEPKAFLDQIAGFFEKNQSLSREEFYAIAKRVRRP